MMVVNKNSIQIFRITSDIVSLSAVFFIICLYFLGISELTIRHVSFLFLIVISWSVIGKHYSMYDDFASRTFTYQLLSIFKTSILLLIIMILIFFLSKNYFFTRPRVFIISFSVSSLIIIVIKEYIIRHFFAYLRKKGKNVRRILIIGANHLGFKFSQLIKNSPHFGYKLIGFIANKSNDSDKIESIGKLEEIEDIINKYRIDEVVITLTNASNELYDDIIRKCNKAAVSVKLIPDYIRFLSKKFQVTTFGDFPIIAVRSEPLEEIHLRFFKRLLDIVFSAVIIILILSWLFPVVFLIHKFTSPGSVLFIQDRVGKKGQIFKCYKFRTMHVDADRSMKATTKGDSRITKFGRILRKTNIDELPQFFNVFLGDMSIVGPRPHALNYEEKYSEFVEEIKMRHKIKPGITGWAQVTGYRGDLEDEKENRKHTMEKIKSDLWYIENWSLTLDLQIILMTVWNMIKGDPNAY